MSLKIHTKKLDGITGYTVIKEIHRSQKHVLFKAKQNANGRDVVIKTINADFLKHEDLLKIRREYDIISQLKDSGAVGSYDLIEYGSGNLALVLEHFGDALSIYQDGPLPIRQFLSIARSITEALSKVHKAGIVHNNIETSNILIDADSLQVKLIDFDQSSFLSQEYLDPSSMLNWEDKSLPFLSPEQTGRINRGVDYRSDLYALGAVFYKLLTNTHIFKAGDDLEWVYHIISQQPQPPHQINKNIPKVLSNIVMKLLSKNAEDRYQSTHGIVADLKRCQEEIDLQGNDFYFDIAQLDISYEFKMPQKLYGRSAEMELLETYFNNASLGSNEFCLVSGYSGVGKTAIVKELGRSIASKNGFLIEGKFDQFKQNAPYTTIVTALSNLIKVILGEPKERLKVWKENILEALDGNGQLIVNYIPELEVVIGKQQQVLDLPIEESHTRFLSSLIDFINVFGTEHSPLVIFLDDLQWTDIPTLNLIKQMVLSDELTYVFLIGAYRNNEVETTHPLNLTLREIEKKRYIDNLELGPLNQKATENLIKDTLLCQNSLAIKLTKKIFNKTHGNPFFSIELLKNLKEKEVIYFDFEEQSWNCNLLAIDKEHYSENVIDILVEKQKELPEVTQHVLQLSACIGATFDLDTLAIISEQSPEQTALALNQALLDHMIIPLDDNYRFFEEDHSSVAISFDLSETLNPLYKFQHDRVQQAAYSQIPEDKKEQLHLRIGQRLLENSEHLDQEEMFLDSINHLNIGRRLIKDRSQQIHLAKLNLSAGIRAKESSAYSSATSYLKIGVELLGEQSWQEHYDLSWQLHNQLQHSYYLTGDWENADQLTDTLLLQSKTPIEKGLILSARTRQYATTQRMKESISAAYQGLLILGFEFSSTPSKTDIDDEVTLIENHLRHTSVSELIDLTEIKDQRAKIASQLIMEIFPAAFLSGSGEMFPYLVLKSVNVGLKYGNSPETAFSYVAYGMLLCGHFNDTKQGYEFGKLGVALSEKLENLALRARIIYVYAMFVHHWSNHWSTMTPWFRKGIEAGYQSGDLLYLAYSAQDCIIWDPSLDLEEASKEHARLLEIVKECEYKDSLDSGTLFLQMQLNFMGLTESQFSLTNKEYNEIDCLEGMRNRHFMTGICNYHLYKAEIHLMYNDAVGALPHIETLESHVNSFMALPQAARYHIVAFLIRAILIHEDNNKSKDIHFNKMLQHKTVVSTWVTQCPENFNHLYHLMKAEIASIENETQVAMTLYEKAIALAKTHRFRRDEAMANEFMARFFLKHKLSKAAQGYLKEAQHIYYRWGAHRKVEHMKTTYGLLNIEIGVKAVSNSRLESSFDKSSVLDFNSILKASQTISGELILEKLLVSTLTILMENAGAQRGFIIVDRDHEIQVIQHQDNATGTIELAEDLKDDKGISILPRTLINNALRTQTPVVIDDARRVNSFSSDPYIKKNKPVSVLCIPLPKYGKWPMAIYLENNIVTGAFNEERIKVIKLLASQAAISMENSRIYQQQEDLLKAQQRFVPSEFLKHLGHDSIINVQLGESVSMEINVLFTDILNFTPLVERLSPEAVIRFLNRLFNEMGIVIKNREGFIDSYQGDQIMALFPTSSFKAVKAAVEMTRALERFNNTSKDEDIPPINLGIGINTGSLVLGTMGALNRMQCSVLGDTVNLASRIESLTRKYGAKLLIGQDTYESIENKTHFSIRMVDYVAVKGKNKAVKLYEVIDAESEDRRELKLKTLNLCSEAMKHYLSRNFKDSRDLWKQAFSIDPFDATTNMFLQRTEAYMKNPPSSSWRGYETLNHK